MLLIYQHEIIIINHKKKTGRVAFRGGAWAAAPCRATGPRGCAARRRCPAGPAGRPGWPPAALRAHVRRRRGCVSVGKNGVFLLEKTGTEWMVFPPFEIALFPFVHRRCFCIQSKPHQPNTYRPWIIMGFSLALLSTKKWKHNTQYQKQASWKTLSE